MRVNVLVVITALGYLVGSERVRADEYAGTPDVRACDQCEDLCRLVDKYLQTQALIDMYGKYAASNENPKPPPDNINELGGSIQDVVWWEFEEWKQTRQLPCNPGPGGRGGTSTELETTLNSKCEILYNKQPLVGEALHDYERAVNCKVLSDSVIEHEKIHQRHCQAAYRTSPSGNTAAQILTFPANGAESELQAHKKHRDMLAEQIRKIVQEHDCGWDPTEGQNSSNAMPSAAQTKAMQERGWKAVEVLWSGGN